MNARAWLAALCEGRTVPGRHLVLVAHPDDETISFGGALCLIEDALIVQVTSGVHADEPDPSVRQRRSAERDAAFKSAGWTAPVLEYGLSGRDAHHGVDRALRSLTDIIADVDVVWTHPYEGGHLDHDTCAWLAQTVCAGRSTLQMEFASYHSRGVKRDVFGAFWPDPSVPTVTAELSGDRLARKRAAVAAYTSQASILRKFPHLHLEPYRQAPIYDFSQPAPPVACRWDLKGYQPSTASWRQCVAARQVAA